MNDPRDRGPGRARGRDWIRMGVLAAVTAVVFWMLFRSVRIDEVFDLLGSARPAPLALGVLLTAAFPLLGGWRWKLVMDALGHRISFGEASSLLMACWPLSTFTPSKGSDLARAYFLRGRAPMSSVVGSVLAERTIDVLALLAFCLTGSLAFGWKALGWASGAFLAAGLLALAALLRIRIPVPQRWAPKVDRMLASLRLLARRPNLLLGVVGVTLANWGASFVQTWLFYLALANPVPWPSLLAALPAAIFVGLLPVTLMGMGTRDAALIRLLASHAPAPISLAVGLLYSLCGYWLPGILGLPFLRKALRQRGNEY